MQNNNYHKPDKTLFDEWQKCIDKDLFLAEKQKKSEEGTSDGVC
ncbi:hypothetical protein NZD88_13920 [Chryseobacterium antibioticum]|uniref:Uncharacterized protein n=1 Tax=Chryseobacterium pyrolae TaxID=2987481 RepID=A0ABT2IJ10_9FLAO|nr:hypothetical protein [Chryseobacterium pyrolae]